MESNIIYDVDTQLKKTISEIMDIDPNTLFLNTYIMRDLGAESIDLLEISVELSALMNRTVDDNQFFLTRLRSYIDQKPQEEISSILRTNYPHLSDSRIEEIIKDLDRGAVLQFQDLVAYINFIQK